MTESPSPASDGDAVNISRMASVNANANIRPVIISSAMPSSVPEAAVTVHRRGRKRVVTEAFI